MLTRPFSEARVGPGRTLPSAFAPGLLVFKVVVEVIFFMLEYQVFLLAKVVFTPLPLGAHPPEQILAPTARTRRSMLSHAFADNKGELVTNPWHGDLPIFEKLLNSQSLQVGLSCRFGSDDFVTDRLYRGFTQQDRRLQLSATMVTSRWVETGQSGWVSQRAPGVEICPTLLHSWGKQAGANLHTLDG